MNWLMPLVGGGLLLVFVVARGLSVRRTREVRAWAGQHGLEFVAGSDRRIGIAFLEIPLIGSGRTGARNHASGQWQGQEIHVFDLVVEPDTEDGRQSSSHHTCVLVKADLPLIPLCIVPWEHDADLSSDLGLEIVVSGLRAFADGFQVTATDPEWAHDILQPDVQAELLKHPRWRLELGGWYCLVAVPGRLAADRFEEPLALARAFLAAIPSAVRAQILGLPAPESSGD